MTLVMLVPFGEFAHVLYRPLVMRPSGWRGQGLLGGPIVNSKRDGTAGRSIGSSSSSPGSSERGPADLATRTEQVPPQPRQGLGQLSDPRARIGILIVVLVLASVVVIGADFVLGAVINTGDAGPSPTPTAAPSTTGQAPTATQFGVVIQGDGGHWTSVSASRVAQMLGHKDFKLLNVKTQYVGEMNARQASRRTLVSGAHS